MKNFGLINTLLLILFIFSLLFPYLLFSLGGYAIPAWSYLVSVGIIVIYIGVVFLGPKSMIEVESVETDEDTILEEDDHTINETSEENELVNLTKVIDNVLAQNLVEENKDKEFASLFMSKLASSFEISQGAMYFSENLDGKDVLVFKGGYAYHKVEEGVYIDYGEGLTGQVAKAQNVINLDQVPEGYITIFSGLGESTPSFLYIYPLVVEGITKGVIEIASFTKVSEVYLQELKGNLNRVAEFINENF